MPASEDPAAVEEEAAAGPVRVAIPDMRSSDKLKELASTLTDVLAVEANQVEGVEAIGMTDIKALLGFEQQKQLLDCSDVSCMAEIGGALGVRAIIDSSLGQAGDTYVLTLSAIDTKEVRAVARTQETVQGKADALIVATRRALRKVLAPLAAPADVAATPAPTPAPASTATAEAGGGGVNIAAIGVMALGGVAVLAAVGLELAALAVLGENGDPIELEGNRYWGSGMQEENDAAAGFELVAIIAAAVGVPVLTGGILWLALSGDESVEEAQP
jgi:hypothetical protein